MDFELNDEQALLREVSRTMLATHCAPSVVRASNGELGADLWRRGAELGWIGLGVPEELGGAGQGLVELCLVAEELGRAVVPGPVAESALAALALAAVPAHDVTAGAAAPAARADGGARATTLADGGARAAFATQGSVSGTREGDFIVLDGRLTPVQSVSSVDWLVVAAQVDGAPALVLVEAAQVVARRLQTLDETRAWFEVTLAGLRVPASHLLADVEWLLAAATVLTAADALGAGERLLEMTVEYVKVREQFGRPLGSFQSVKHKAADMLTSVKGARAAIYYAAMALDARAADGVLAASVAKAFTSEAMSSLAGEALQTHGGVGFTWEHDLHLYLRRLKVDEVLDGTPADHHERIVVLLESASADLAPHPA